MEKNLQSEAQMEVEAEVEENSPEELVPIELLNEKLENIMQKLEQLNVDKEIGEKEKNRDSRVIIDKIELENFKSYAGVKKIGPLHYRFNAVVGPNGSGKSNLMESLLFVFGKRAKRMRLNKLNELIHNSTTVNNLRVARVTIFFKEIRDIESVNLNNEMMDNKNYEEIANSEFVLSREVYKNGSSKYFLDDKEIYFDKLCEILNSRGIDLKHNRFLILQGEVEQISMMKPKAGIAGEVGLLEFLEDIIGTHRYVALIERLAKDIDELSEIKVQKANRVKITKNELDQLEDVKNSSTEYYKKEKELHIFGHLDFLVKRHAINKSIIEKTNIIKQIQQTLTDIDIKIKETIEANSLVLEEHRKIRKEQETFKQKKAELFKKTDALDELDKVKRADIENYSKNIAKTKAALEKLNKNYQNQTENIRTANLELPKREKEIVELVEIKANLENYINQKESEIFERTEKIQIRKRDCEKKIQPYEDMINNNKFSIEQNSSTIHLISGKVNKITNDLTLNENKLGELNKILKEKSELMRSIDKKTSEIEAGFKTSKDSLITMNDELDAKYKVVQNLLAKLSEVKSANNERSSRNTILESLMKAQNEGKLSGIYGRLGDLGVIDARYDIAVTTACSYLDSIVVENVDHAQKCLDFLKKFNIGRATFLILEKVAWVESNMKRDFNVPNNCERLFDLVKFKNNRLGIAFYFALRDTLVTSDLKTATSVAYGSTRHRVVTLNGELIEIYGTMSGGGKAKKGGMLNKESIGANVDDNIYTNDYINRLTTEYEFHVKEYEAFKIERNGVETRTNSLNSSLQEILILKNKTENEIIGIEKSIAEMNRTCANLNSELSKYKKDTAKLEELISANKDLEMANQKYLSDSSELRNELAAINDEIGKISGEDFHKKKEEFKQLKKRIDSMEKEINNMKNIIENAPEILEKLKSEIQGKERVFKEYEDLIEKIKVELGEIENQALALYGEIDVCEKEIAELEKRFTDKNKEVEDLKVLIRKMKDDQEKVKSEIVDINAEIKKLEKSEKAISDDINKNKKNFQKLTDEFGFIDEFEKEIRELNKKEKEVMITDEDDRVTPEIELDQEKELEYDKKPKPKTSSNYSKYIIPATLETNFKIEELEEISKFSKEIAYEYTMLQTKINDMKPNMNAILQYKNKLIELKSREEDLNQTSEKLSKGKQIFECVKARRYNEFMEGFNIISAKLKEMYQLITNGGDAELELLDSLDPFSEGILFSVRPFKKSWKQISNLSGGEKTLSSLSLIFALHHYKPSPLYVLDEIDAALDFKNVSIIANYIKEQTKNSQFIIISLRNHMFELANKLVGIYKTFDITKCITFNPDAFKLNQGNDEEKEKNKNTNH